MRISWEMDKKEAQVLRDKVHNQLEALKNTKTPLAMMATILYQSVMKNFAEQGTDKEKWKELSPFTIMNRRQGKKGNLARAIATSGRPASAFGVKILQDTGFMKASITPSVRDGVAEVGLNGQEAEIGRVHQFGKPRSGNEPAIPRRSFLVLRDKDRERIMAVARLWFFGSNSAKKGGGIL